MAQSAVLDGGNGFGMAADKIRLRLWLRYLVFLLFMEGLSKVLGRWSGRLPLHTHLRLGGAPARSRFTGPRLRLGPGTLGQVAALPFVMAYIASDVYFIAYGDVVRVIDVGNLPELLKVLPFGKIAGADLRPRTAGGTAVSFRQLSKILARPHRGRTLAWG